MHRGHGIFDTAAIVDGKIYDLEAHLDRFLRSADRSKLRLPGSREEMRDIIVQDHGGERPPRRLDSLLAVVRTRQPRSSLPPQGAEPGFFVMVFAGLSYPERWYTEGLRVMTTTYPIKPPLYAITKATNYLPNVLMQMEAKEAGFDNGVFIDEDGYVGESSNMNVAFVTRDAVLVHPKFDHILAGCTSLRLLELARALQGQGPARGALKCATSPSPRRAPAARCCSSAAPIKVASVIQWDDQVIGDGKPGPAGRALLRLLEQDMRSGDRLIPVPC